MIKKLNKIDFLFIGALLLGLLLHLHFFFLVPWGNDESFYITHPFQLVHGDSLIRDNWHLTQFSSLFSYIPVYIWTAIKGSADGIFLFLRCIYLAIHTGVSVLIYRFFREYGKWAIMASLLFYIQIPYKVFAISYQSVFLIGLLILAICLLSIYKNQSAKLYAIAGVCYGCCCVCNPLFCILFPIYLLAYVICSLKNRAIKGTILQHNNGKTKKRTKKQKRELRKQEAIPNSNKYDCFFTKEAVLFFICGILIVALIAVVFFFATGGTIRSITNNLGFVLGSSEYTIFSSASLFSKLTDTFMYYSQANFNFPWILPILSVFLLLDKNRKCNSHRVIYMIAVILWAVMFIFGFIKADEFYTGAVTLPFFVFSTLCYLLTEKKNKVLFYCMYLPGLIGTLFQYLAANTHLAVIGIMLAVCNVPAVFFVRDLLKEFSYSIDKESKVTFNKKASVLCSGIIIAALCVQIAFSCVFYQYLQISRKDVVKATTGSYSGLYLTKEKYDIYGKTINDLDFIKSISRESDPVLVLSYENWMYLYLERPIASYTTWYRGAPDIIQLTSYYRVNSKKIPKYIYIKSSDPQSPTTQALIRVSGELFEYTRQDLSYGVLLTVTEFKKG